MISRRTLTWSASALAAALLAPSAATACSCIPLSPESVRESDAAVIATLKRVRADETGRRGTFVYRVRRALVGERLGPGDRVRVRSPLDSAACGLAQDRGRYGLVLDRDDGRWHSSLCSQTTPRALRALARGERSSARYC